TYLHLFRLTGEQRSAVRNIRAFAMTSAHNVAQDWVRHNRVVPIDAVEDLSALPVVDDEADLEAIVHTHQQLMRVADGIAQLPERCREAFTLRHVYGLSQKEIARRLKTTEGAVEQLLNRGLRRCAELMSLVGRDEAPKGYRRRTNLLGRWRRWTG